MPGFASYPQVSFDEFVARLDAALPGLPRQEAKLAQYILLNLDTLGLETGRSLSVKVGVSEVTVGRLLRRLGCDGMRGLRDLLRQHYSVASETRDVRLGMDIEYGEALEAELGVVTSIFQQTGSPDWTRAVRLLSDSRRVYVTGFQSVRGTAEDFARRLSLARGGVQFLAPQDGMLGEWAGPARATDAASCLVLVDVVPNAREAPEIMRIAKDQGRGCIVMSDEYCHWSWGIADAVIHAPSRTGLFLESTLGLVLGLSLLVDGVARVAPEAARERMSVWKRHSRRLKLFH